MTSAPFQDPERGWEVLVFPVPLGAPGVTVRNDWDTLGMRATGSHSIELADVFVADDAIALRRPRGQWHPSWSVIVTVAAPIYMAPYIGIAERAAALARETVAGRAPDPVLIASLGELGNALTVAQMAFREMIEIANNFDFAPKTEDANRMLIRKTIAANADDRDGQQGGGGRGRQRAVPQRRHRAAVARRAGRRVPPAAREEAARLLRPRRPRPAAGRLTDGGPGFDPCPA